MAGQDSFTAQVSAWVMATQERVEAVTKESTQRVVEVMQRPVGAGGNMPVDTGFLRASLRASTSMMPVLQFAKGSDGSYSYTGGEIALVIAGAQMGQTMYFGYTANYAPHAEYGTSKMAARRFVGLAAAQWQQIVNQVCNELRSQAGSA